MIGGRCGGLCSFVGGFSPSGLLKPSIVSVGGLCTGGL